MSASEAQALGDRLCGLRRAMGWDRNHLGERLGVSERTLRRMEKGEHVIHPSLLLWLEEVLMGVNSNPLPKDWDSWRPLNVAGVGKAR